MTQVNLLIDARVDQLPLPPGFERTPLGDGSFGTFLRHLPLKNGTPDVLLFNGEKKLNQTAHYAVIDLDVGTRDLQQCADAVIRLRAEYLFAHNQYDAIAFHFTSGDLYRYVDHASGKRAIVSGTKVRFDVRASAAAKEKHSTLREYLDALYMYAGSRSLSAELTLVGNIEDVRAGDVFIEGGSPGHAVTVIDVAEREGKRAFMLAQSYMPAQDIHVLKNPRDPEQGPWYPATVEEKLPTPEWTFIPAKHHKRFP
jgi:hypothetical protein